VPLTATVAASVDNDYDLARAEVRAVREERGGQQLCGYVALVAPRRYAMPGGDEDAIVKLFLSDVRTARFDSDDDGGATLTADATGVEVRVGAHAHFHADSATMGFDDPLWHLSHAGQTADAASPHRRTSRRRPRQTGWPLGRGAALDAGRRCFMTSSARSVGKLYVDPDDGADGEGEPVAAGDPAEPESRRA
jgi:hypothetical protein